MNLFTVRLSLEDLRLLSEDKVPGNIKAEAQEVLDYVEDTFKCTKQHCECGD